MANQMTCHRPRAMNIPHVSNFVGIKAIAKLGVHQPAGMDQFIPRVNQDQTFWPLQIRC